MDETGTPGRVLYDVAPRLPAGIRPVRDLTGRLRGFYAVEPQFTAEAARLTADKSTLDDLAEFDPEGV